MIKHSTILFGILNWGLGHASRSIPLIHALLKAENRIILASDGEAYQLLSKELPFLKIEAMDGYNVKYPTNNMFINISLSSWQILKAITKEHQKLKSLIDKHQPDYIISDNRLGFYSKKVPSIYISHQLNIHHSNPWIANVLTKIHQYFIHKYQSCWVPDYKEDNKSLAGKLSRADLSIPIHYLGPLSRMAKRNSVLEFDIGILLSGPEPQRTKLEEALLNKLSKYNHYKILLVRGSNKASNYKGPVEVHNLLTGDTLNQLLNKCKLIICRSGYSSIMDLEALDKPAILIPTPGQTEQEYLAEHLSKYDKYQILKQSDVNKIDFEAFLSKSYQ